MNTERNHSSIRNRSVKEELMARAFTIENYYQEVEAKEEDFNVLKLKLDVKERILESKFIERSRVMFIADKYTPCWDELTEYHSASPLKRLLFKRSTRLAYKEVCKRLHCDGIPDIKSTLEDYLKTYNKLKNTKRELERAMYGFNLALECYSDFIDTL